MTDRSRPDYRQKSLSGTKAAIERAVAKQHCLRLTKEQVRKALAARPTLLVRKRLAAIQAILAGKSVWEAAAVARSTPESVRRWTKLFEAGGLVALLHDSRQGRYQRVKRLASEKPLLAGQIKQRIRIEKRPWARGRLHAVRAALQGHTLNYAAGLADIHPSRVLVWLDWFERGGIDEVLAHPPGGAPKTPLGKGDPTGVARQTIARRAAAQKARARRSIERMLDAKPAPSARTQQRLRAVQRALRTTIEEAAKASDVSESSLRRWLRAATAGNLVSLVEKKHPGRPPTPA